MNEYVSPPPNDVEPFDVFARTGSLAPLGTLIDELKTKVDPETGARFRKLVHEANMDTAGALRDWVYMLVHGKTFTQIQMDAVQVKRAALFGKGPFKGPVKDASNERV